MTEADAGSVLAIYAEGIAEGHSTFESETPDWAGFDAARLPEPRLVIELDKQVCGWAVLSSVSQRPVYAGVAEVTLYLTQSVRGRGWGVQLLQALIVEAEACGFWTLQAIVFTENAASIRLHERCGFRLVGRRERIGRMRSGPLAGQWRDTLLLERRSRCVGLD